MYPQIERSGIYIALYNSQLIYKYFNRSETATSGYCTIIYQIMWLWEQRCVCVWRECIIISKPNKLSSAHNFLWLLQLVKGWSGGGDSSSSPQLRQQHTHNIIIAVSLVGAANEVYSCLRVYVAAAAAANSTHKNILCTRTIHLYIRRAEAGGGRTRWHYHYYISKALTKYIWTLRLRLK